MDEDFNELVEYRQLDAFDASREEAEPVFEGSSVSQEMLDAAFQRAIDEVAMDELLLLAEEDDYRKERYC